MEKIINQKACKEVLGTAIKEAQKRFEERYLIALHQKEFGGFSYSSDVVQSNKKELKRQEKNQETLKGFINLIMVATGTEKFEGTAGKLSYRKSNTLKLIDNFEVYYKDCDFITTETLYKIDKKMIKDIISKGIEIDGAEIIEKNNLQIK